MAPPKKRGLPKPLPEGFILTDSEKKEWRLGGVIGQGGCGLIYLASRDVDRPVAAETGFVIKVESQENGPLFSELKFYQRAAKAENMQKWRRSRKVDFLGIPTYWGSGLAEYKELRYRFMAMDRLGSDLQKICERSRGRLKKATVLQLGRGLVDVLEYIHENEYVHADIKASNLMLGCRDPEQVYLADYGLSYRYCPDGVHKEYKENPKRGHNGTMEYTSLDAHRGAAPSRRGDLQILGFCLLHWLCGSLPWDKILKNPTQVQEAKDRLMDNLPGSVQHLSERGAGTDEVAAFLTYVKTLDYKDKPNYPHLKQLLASVVTGRLDFSVPREPAGESTGQRHDPPAREKTAGRARGPSKARAVATEPDDDDDGDEEEEEKSKPVPARYIRGPPLTKPPSQREEDGALPPVSRPLRLKPAVPYGEDDSDDDEEEEEEARPKAIPACYLRGPPLGPRAPPKQKAKSSGRKTSERRGRVVHSQSGNQTHYRGRREERLPPHDEDTQGSEDWDSPRDPFLTPPARPALRRGAGYSHGRRCGGLCWEHRHGDFSEQGGSAPERGGSAPERGGSGPKWGAGPERGGSAPERGGSGPKRGAGPERGGSAPEWGRSGPERGAGPERGGSGPEWGAGPERGGSAPERGAGPEQAVGPARSSSSWLVLVAVFLFLGLAALGICQSALLKSR